MAACADIEFEIDKISKTDSDSSSYHNVTHSENNQNDLLKNLFFQLGQNWFKKALPYSFEKVFPCTQFSNMVQLLIQLMNTFNEIYRYNHL